MVPGRVGKAGGWPGPLPGLISCVVLVKVIIYVQKVKKKKQLHSKLWGQKFSSNNFHIFLFYWLIKLVHKTQTLIKPFVNIIYKGLDWTTGPFSKHESLSLSLSLSVSLTPSQVVLCFLLFSILLL